MEPPSGSPTGPVTCDDVAAARHRLRPHLHRTPTLVLAADALGLPGDALDVVAKLDLLHPTGSFKVRGATSLLTGVAVPPSGVVAASGGNFGLAIAWAARRLGHRATIVVPRTSPREKIAPIAALGADLVVVEGYYADALAEAERRETTTGALMAHAYDERLVVAGQGTALAELREQADVDTVMVACGGGGLLAGTLAAAGSGSAPGPRVVAVETPGTAALHAALRAGAPVDVEVSGLAASSLGARRIGGLAWAARDRLHAAVLVTDEQIRATQQLLWRAARLVAEPGGAAALTALVVGAYRPDPDERVAVLVCGGNTDPGSVVTPTPG